LALATGTLTTFEEFLCRRCARGNPVCSTANSGFRKRPANKKIRRLFSSSVKAKTSVGFFGSANKQIVVLPNEIRRKIHFGPEFAALPFGQTRFRPRTEPRHYAILTNPKTLSMLPKSIFIVPSFPRLLKRVRPFLKTARINPMKA
jgi:hypothetical protein